MASPTSSLAEPPPSPQWVNLPPEITSMILQKLGSTEILFTARRVCRTWRNVCKDPTTWRVIKIVIDKGSRFDSVQILHQECKLSCHAVDLSQGELLDIEVHGYYEMIEYIAQRSPKLRCLRLTGDYPDFCEELSEAVKKFPLLEEMHLIYMSLDDKSIKTIIDTANWCPLLTSLSLNTRGTGLEKERPADKCNEVAFAVSKMPKLRHLRLIGSLMTNEGLKAILDGCSLLESLDIRKCSNLKLDGMLGKRCSQQIKHLRLPNDSIEDYPLFYEDDSWSEEIEFGPYIYDSMDEMIENVAERI